MAPSLECVILNPMKRELLKTPADYQSFQFRIDEEEKGRLIKLIDPDVALYNRKLTESEHKYRKNNIIVITLYKSLKPIIHAKK